MPGQSLGYATRSRDKLLPGTFRCEQLIALASEAAVHERGAFNESKRPLTNLTAPALLLSVGSGHPPFSLDGLPQRGGLQPITTGASGPDGGEGEPPRPLCPTEPAVLSCVRGWLWRSRLGWVPSLGDPLRKGADSCSVGFV